MNRIEKENLELKVQIAASWSEFDSLCADIEALRNRIVIDIGKALEKAKKQSEYYKKIRALPE